MSIITRNRNEIDEAVARMKAAYSIDELWDGFAGRTLDDELRELGWLVLSGHDREAIPAHIFVWTGYEELKYGGAYVQPPLYEADGWEGEERDG